MAWNSALSIVGAAMARQITPDNVWARFMGFCLAGAYSVNFPLTLAMSTGNVGGYTKRVTVNAMVLPSLPPLTFSQQVNLTSISFVIDIYRLLHRKCDRSTPDVRF